MKNMNKVTNQFEHMTPKVNFSKSGYEIRTQVLDIAHNHVWQDFNAKMTVFEASVVRDCHTGEIITCGTVPETPSTDQVLDTAQKFYEFVSGKKDKEKSN